ncbi:hypothetical protein ACHAXS_002241 [Conticribra weissflogii]
MESLSQAITTAIQTSDYSSLSTIFSPDPPTTPSTPETWHSLGQGERRQLSSHFLQTSVASPTFYPQAFHSPQIMTVISTTLAHVPPTVEGAADNVLRQKIFDFQVNEREDYATAAKFLSGMRMEDRDESSVYYMDAIDRCDVFVKVAECYLEEELTVEAEGAVTKAGTIMEAVPGGISGGARGEDGDSDGDDEAGGGVEKRGNAKDERAITLMLRYKSTYARVLDANRKFLQAASKYHDLSTAYLHTDAVDVDDLLNMLGRAITCAILAPSSAQRQRMLGLVSSIIIIFSLFLKNIVQTQRENDSFFPMFPSPRK